MGYDLLRGRTTESEVKDFRKGNRRSHSSLCLTLSEFIKKDSLLYTVFRGKIGQGWQKAIVQWDKVSRKLIKKCFTEGRQDSLCVPD